MKILGKKLLLIGGFMLIPTINIWLCKPKDGTISLKKEENSIKEKTIAMYVQNEEGGYDTSSSTKFPTDGYVLNLEKSSCKNGGVLSQDPATKKISLSATNADACTLYFEKTYTLTMRAGSNVTGETVSFELRYNVPTYIDTAMIPAYMPNAGYIGVETRLVIGNVSIDGNYYTLNLREDAIIEYFALPLPTIDPVIPTEPSSN